MAFDISKFGEIASMSSSLNETVCWSHSFDDDKHFGLVRKADVLSMIARTSVGSPSQAQLDFAAALLVFTSLGITQDQSRARAMANKHMAQWYNSADEIFSRGPGQAWDVPVCLVVFQRSW
jgi:hypothetical protein